MKAILVFDATVLDDGRHLCNECPIWNKEHFFCQYDFNTEAKGCPLKPMPMKRETHVYWNSVGIGNIPTHEISDYDKGWNDCVEFLEGEEND